MWSNINNSFENDFELWIGNQQSSKLLVATGTRIYVQHPRYSYRKWLVYPPCCAPGPGFSLWSFNLQAPRAPTCTYLDKSYSKASSLRNNVSLKTKALSTLRMPISCVERTMAMLIYRYPAVDIQLDDSTERFGQISHRRIAWMENVRCGKWIIFWSPSPTSHHT
ncbi:hypothetical protein Pdw03_2972 [Penicillium digitatum]|uniref:Uncharacterized protein n=1 Tax=Penicillium digitatum TaxID=36651 RepID=A0A7T6XFC3_PENDI|nr:hypothetical protein Pdw03_2972 [Penicillium digitatum]